MYVFTLSVQKETLFLMCTWNKKPRTFTFVFILLSICDTNAQNINMFIFYGNYNGIKISQYEVTKSV